jgi:hypothetical protein
MMHVYIEPDVDKTKLVYNLITINIDDNGNESTEIIPYPTLEQAQEAAERKHTAM